MTTSSLVDSTTTATSPSQTSVIPKYRLIVRQQPEKSRLCSFKEKGEPLHYAKVNNMRDLPKTRRLTNLPFAPTVDRRPLDPPPIVQLITDTRTGQYPYFFLYATLVTESGEEELSFVESTRMTAGTIVQSLHRLRDCDNEEGAFFIFADISIRMEGFFRLRFTLFEITGLYATSRCSVLSGVFQVYSPKSFPGMSESTFLTRSFSEQGVRIRIRKETRANTSSSSKRRRSDGNHDPNVGTTSQPRHQSLPIIKSTHSIMSMKNILISPVQESTTHQKHESHLSPIKVQPSPIQSSSYIFNRSADSFKATSVDPTSSFIDSDDIRQSSSSPLLESSSPPSSSRHRHPDHRYS